MKQPDPPVLDWAVITAALTATGCQPDETVALLDRGKLIITVPSTGAAMMFAAQLAMLLIGGDMAGPRAKLVHTAGEVEDILARASDAWLHHGDGIIPEAAPVLALAFPGVAVTGAPADAATQSCRQCGCTELHACPGGCAWAEPGLCTTCAGWPARRRAVADAGSPAEQAHEALAASLPENWVEAAEAWYSMHGAGLVRNLLAGAAPLIAAAERERIALAIEASIVSEPGRRYERWPCTCLNGRECFPHAVQRVMNQVTARCDEDTWPVVIAGAVWDAVEPLIRRDAASIARQPDGQEEWSQGEVQGAHGCGYRLLADAVIAHLDVRDGEEAEVALCVEAVERAATPRLTEAGRWQLEQARDLLGRWDSAHGPDIHGTDRSLADQLRGLLALVDQLAPQEPGTG